MMLEEVMNPSYSEYGRRRMERDKESCRRRRHDVVVDSDYHHHHHHCHY